MLATEARYAEPEIFVGSNWEGLSFEIPAGRVADFVTLLARELKPTRIALHYRENGGDRTLEDLNGNLPRALAQIGDRLLGHDFSADFDNHTLYSGGDGCFSLQAVLPKPKLLEIARALLDLLGVEHRLERDDFQIGMIDGQTEVYR
ncbi:MAG: hypothetical protein HY784_13005 [Chloroflexi bacterium]|nr:hypothetical protein [Chloroflexota bacterium]